MALGLFIYLRFCQVGRPPSSHQQWGTGGVVGYIRQFYRSQFKNALLLRELCLTAFTSSPQVLPYASVRGCNNHRVFEDAGS